MTVITEPVVNLAGLADTGEVFFYVPQLRERASGHGIVTPDRVIVRPVASVLTTPDLNPGPARVKWGLMSFDIVIPDSATPVRLWPLIQAGLPAPSDGDDFVFNGGGISRTQAMTLTAYSSVVKDPATLYFLY